MGLRVAAGRAAASSLRTRTRDEIPEPCCCRASSSPCEVMGVGLGLDAWWDEPAYHHAQDTFTQRGTFIFGKLRDHDAAKLKVVLDDLYRDAIPDPMDITKFEWEVIPARLTTSRGPPSMAAPFI